jgi:hypothetical protein
MYTLGQLRKITGHLPDDVELRIEACFTPEGNRTAPVFEIITSSPKNEIVLLPQEVYISLDGKSGLHIKHSDCDVTEHKSPKE